MRRKTQTLVGSLGMISSLNNDLYSLEKISGFLDETFGKSVKVKDYFRSFVRSAINKTGWL